MTKLSALILALVLCGGCSWGARGYRAVASKECSSSPWAYRADAAVAVAGAAVAGVGLAGGREHEPGDHRSEMIGYGFLTAIVAASAAISGHTWASECRVPRAAATALR